MSLKFLTNLNSTPYHDDFDENKKFLKILFNPKLPVQVRELNQLQTILSDQLSRFGDHFLKDGTMIVDGNINVDTNVEYVKLNSTISVVNSDGVILGDQLLNTFLSNFENRTVKGKQSGAEFFVRKVTINDETDENTIYGYHITGNNKLLSNEEIETISEGDLSNHTAIVSSSQDYTGKSSFASVNSGIFYVSGMFHLIERQEIILEKYKDSPKYRIGVEVVEKIMDYSDDTSLFDNAKETPNKNAPGADRFSVDLVLSKKKYDDETDSTVFKNSSCQFYELVRVDGSKRINISKKFPFTYMAKTISEERKKNGDKLVKQFQLDIDDNLEDETKLFLNFGPGKAYVNGFCVETNSKQTISIPKSRETGIVENDYLFFDYGNYFYVEIVQNGGSFNSIIPEFKKHEQMELFDIDGFKIGKLKVKFIEFDEKDFDTTIYKLYFHDLEMNADQDLARESVSKIFYLKRFSKEPVSFKIHDKSRKSKLSWSGQKETFISDIKNNSLIFDVSNMFIKTINSFQFMSFASEIVYPFPTSQSNSDLWKVVFYINENQNFSDEILNKTLDTNILFEKDLINKYFILLDPNTGKIYDNLQIAINSQKVEIDIRESDLFGGENLLLIFKFLADVKSRKKTKKIGKVSLENFDRSLEIPLNVVDAIEIQSVYFNGDESVDYKDYFYFDNGQRDNHYGLSTILLDESNLDLSENISNVDVNFTYYEHDSSAGFFTLSSYEDLSDVQDYVSPTTGKSYDLLNSIDFRPTVDAYTNMIEESYFPINSETDVAKITYERYLGRIDRVIIDENKKIDIIKGTSSVIPKVPDEVDGKFTIYTLVIPPYTKNKDEIDIVDEHRKEYLEILTEKAKNQQILNQQNSGQIHKTGIFVDDFSDHSLGDVNSSDYSCSIDYIKKELRNSFQSSSIKMKFNEECSSFVDPCGDSYKSVIQKGPYVMPKYEQKECLINPLISQSILVNPHKSVSWHGDVKIFPKMDKWYDDSVDPEVVSNIKGKNDNWKTKTINNSKGFGTQWNDWQDIWSENEELLEIPNNILKTKESFSKKRDVLNFISKPNISKNNKNSFKPIKEIVHYSLNNKVFFICDNLKPNTQFFGFLDEVLIDAKSCEILNVSNSLNFIDDFANGEIVTGQTSGSKAKILRISLNDSTKIFIYDKIGSFSPGENIIGEKSGKITVLNFEENSEQLISNNIGELCGYFQVPEKIKTGEKIFRLTDFNSSDVSKSTSLCETTYHIQGKFTDSKDDLKSTRIFERKRSHMNVANSLYEDVYSREFLMSSDDNGKLLEKVDYLSQSFEVNRTIFKEGIFLSSIDLFFKKKDSNLPVSIEIRPMVNGYPSPNKILPFSQVTIASKDVKVSDVPSVELKDGYNTRFEFDVPLYLNPDEYCIVIKSNGHEYELWSCENGKVVLDETGSTYEEQLIVTQQPNVGELFSSHNSGTYQSINNQHLSFRLNRCDFSPGSFRSCFDVSSSDSNPFNLFNFQILLLDKFEDVSDVEFEYSFDGVNFSKFQENRNIELKNPLKQNVIDDNFQITAKWSSMNSFVSPIFDLDTMNLIKVSNSKESSYVSKIVYLNETQKSKDIRVFLDAYKPYGSTIDVYYKIANSNDVMSFDSRNWNKLTFIQPKTKYSMNDNDFIEYEFGNLDGINFYQEQFTEFDMFSVKIVMSNSSNNFIRGVNPSRIKDLRVISLKDPVGTPLEYELIADKTELYEANEDCVNFTLYTNAPDYTKVPFTFSGIQLDDINTNTEIIEIQQRQFTYYKIVQTKSWSIYPKMSIKEMKLLDENSNDIFQTNNFSSIIASSTSSFNYDQYGNQYKPVISNIYDGSLNRGWENYYTSGESPDSMNTWILITLNNPQNISGLSFYGNTDRKDWKLYGSTDNQNWIELYSVTDDPQVIDEWTYHYITFPKTNNSYVTGLKGYFDVRAGQSSVQVCLKNDFIPEDEILTCSLDNVYPIISRSVKIIDNPDHISYDIQFVDCENDTELISPPICNYWPVDLDDICFDLKTHRIEPGTKIEFLLRGIPQYDIRFKNSLDEIFSENYCYDEKMYLELKTTKVPPGSRISFIIREIEGTYTLSAPETINENDNLTITLNTQGLEYGDIVPFKISGIELTDISPNLDSFQDHFVIGPNGNASKTYKISVDNIQEDETFKLELLNGEDFVEVKIVDIVGTVTMNDTSNDV